MKNLVYVAIVAILAFLAYKFILNTDNGQATIAQTPITESKPDISLETAEPDSAFQDLISKSAANADVFILEPGNGTTVSSPVTVKFGITNMTVAKAGENVKFSGHHHLLINLGDLPDMTAPLPATDQVIHFGGAQTETTIELEPGEHTLQLLLGNYLHIPHDKPVLSKKITITVE